MPIASHQAPPTIGATAFVCPYSDCTTFAKQSWSELATYPTEPSEAERLAAYEQEQGVQPKLTGPVARPHLPEALVTGVFVSHCDHCNRVAIWVGGRLAWPDAGGAPSPNADLPPPVIKDYEEAGAIADDSPRGAAALLRLAVEKLCAELEPQMTDLNDGIGRLVKRGLNARIQEALDIVRVIGNNAVHPGQIDLQDDSKTVAVLFGLVNLVADAMITTPKQIKGMYETLPKGARKAIEKRDGQ